MQNFPKACKAMQKMCGAGGHVAARWSIVLQWKMLSKSNGGCVLAALGQCLKYFQDCSDSASGVTCCHHRLLCSLGVRWSLTQEQGSCMGGMSSDKCQSRTWFIFHGVSIRSTWSNTVYISTSILCAHRKCWHR